MVKAKLGAIYLSRGVARICDENEKFHEFVRRCLVRHARGDWGDVCEEDWKENEFSLKHGFRLLSVYKIPKELDVSSYGYQDDRVWVITEAGGIATTVLFPSEY